MRPKITALLLNTLADNFDQLLPNQLVNLCRVLIQPESKNTDVCAKGSAIIEGLELDKFILSQIGSFTQLDLLDAVDVFANSTLSEL